jgi:hypothetical protein
VRNSFCGRIVTHDAHPWRDVLWVTPQSWWERFGLRLWSFRRWCEGALVTFCGRDTTHPSHWHGELHDELCLGSGLSGRCVHGEQLLNTCPDCEDAAETGSGSTGV